MDLQCPNCGKPITVSEQYYNQEVNCPGCDQSLFLEESEDQVEPASDKIVSTVSEELHPATETEVRKGTEHHEPMGNKVASVLAKIIGVVFIGLAIKYGLNTIMILFSGPPPGWDLDERFPYYPKWAKAGAYSAIIILPLIFGFLGWLLFYLARKNNQSKTSHQSS